MPALAGAAEAAATAADAAGAAGAGAAPIGKVSTGATGGVDGCDAAGAAGTAAGAAGGGGAGRGGGWFKGTLVPHAATAPINAAPSKARSSGAVGRVNAGMTAGGQEPSRNIAAPRRTHCVPSRLARPGAGRCPAQWRRADAHGPRRRPTCSG